MSAPLPIEDYFPHLEPDAYEWDRFSVPQDSDLGRDYYYVEERER